MTLIIAASTLLERKFLSLIQRRVGPQFVGYKGRLQYIADALKLFGKGVLIPNQANKYLFIVFPSIVLGLCYSIWINSVWGPNVIIIDIEFNLMFISIFSVLFGLFVILTGYFSKNKYAMLASIRAGLGLLNLEIFLGLLLLHVVVLNGSVSFMDIVNKQEVYISLFSYFFVLGLIVITFLLEVNRTPFDLSEAESELVAGYNVEYGGFLFGLYYLGEYLHLLFFSLIFATLFFSGWENPFNIFTFFYNIYIL